MDSETAVAPSIKRTWFLSLVTGLLGKMAGRDGRIASAGQDGAVAEDESDDASGVSSDAPGSGTATPKEGSDSGRSRNGRIAATTMAGGRRRKAVKKK